MPKLFLSKPLAATAGVKTRHVAVKSPARSTIGFWEFSPANRKNGYRYIERCDACERFSSDNAASKAYAKTTSVAVVMTEEGKLFGFLDDHLISSF